MVPAEQFFLRRDWRGSPQCPDLLVQGPAHLFRAAWLGGARDYLKEPWEPEELFLRLRGPTGQKVEWEEGAQRFRLEGRALTSARGMVQLTAAGASVLEILILRRGSPVSRNVLGWAAGCSEGRTIDNLIARIRRKLALLGGVEGPVTVREVGYRLP